MDLVAVNECRCVVEFAIKVRGGDGQERTAKAVVPERSRQVLLAVPTAPGTGKITFDYGYVIGRPDAVHAPGRPYRAPFALAQSFVVIAGAAARHHAPGCREPQCDRHRDAGRHGGARRARGPRHQRRAPFLPRRARHRASATKRTSCRCCTTTARPPIYAHLQMDTIRVRPGQRVERGEYIANSGNTGFSSGPHLHFVVVRNAGFRSESVPVVFEGPGGTSVAPRTGRRADGLLSGGPGPQRADEFAERGEWRRAGHSATQVRDRVAAAARLSARPGGSRSPSESRQKRCGA